MFRSERAKQFAPFDALKGLQEELRKREQKFLFQEKKELTEEQANALNVAIQKCKKGDLIKRVYYFNGRYIEVEGQLKQKDFIYKYIKIGDEKIFFDDLLSLSLTSSV